MALDDKMRRAAAETRAAMAGRRREPMAQVRRRVVMQRVFAVAAGAAVVFLTVGVVGLGGSSDVQLTPPGVEVTTTEAATTTVPEVAGASSTTSTAVTTTTMLPAKEDGDGLSDLADVPEGWLENLGEGSQLLLAEDGIRVAVLPVTEEGFEGAWDLHIEPAADFDAVHMFGSDYVPGKLADVWLELVVVDDDPMVAIAGIGPLGASRIDLRLGTSETIVLDRVFQRPAIDRSVFIGSVPASVLVDNAPVVFDLWVVSPAGTESVNLPVSGSSIVYRSGRVSDSYDGPITTELFFEPLPLVVDTVRVASFPRVVECDGGQGIETPPNQGRIVLEAEVLDTPLAAFEAIMAGELSDPWFPQRGYVEFIDADGDVAFGVGFDADFEGVVMLIKIVPKEGGWAVASWEGSGC